MGNSIKNNSDLDMTTGDPSKLIIKFAIPLLIGNVFQQFYNVVDTIVVGNMLGPKALAAVGSGVPFLLVLISLFMGMGIATTIIIAQYYGARDHENIDKTVGTIYRANLIIVIPFTLFGVLFSKKFLQLISVPDDGTLEMATTYLRVMFLGIFGNAGFNTNAGILQGLGDSMTSLRFLIIATVINTVLDILFVGPLGMGVAGAALATIIAQLISFILGVIYINKCYKHINIHPLRLKYDDSIFRRIMKLGIPSAIQNAAFSIGIMLIYSLINGFGYYFMAGYTAAMKIDNLVFLPIQSITNGLTTYTGQNVGAKDLKRVKMGVKSGLKVSISVTVVFSIVILILSKGAMRIFTSDQKVIEAGLLYLKSLLPYYWLMAVLFTYNAILRGVGKTVIPLISTIVSLWIARIPMAYLLTYTFGKEYLFFSYPIGWVAGCIMSVSYYYFGNWRKDLNFKPND